MKRMVFYLCLLLFTLLLASCSDTGSNSSSTQSGSLSATIKKGNFREYSLPQSNSGLMRPAIDSKGRIWFGEMGHNFLAFFDPYTSKFQQMTPPHGRSGIMGVVVAPDDTIWFVEQYANYIGHYFPITGSYQVYTLPTLTVPDPGNNSQKLNLPSAPNDLVLDAKGNVWFTELNADSIGRLTISTSRIQEYPLSTKKSIQKLNPYGITIDRQGMVWFTESSTNSIGRLDPATGSIRYFTMQGPVIPLMEITSDASGTLWMTSFSGGLLLNFNPHNGIFTTYFAPSSGNGTGGIYGITITPDNEIWVTISAENVIARLDVQLKRFTYYLIPTHASLPLGLVMGANATLWFTEAGSDKIGMLQL